MSSTERVARMMFRKGQRIKLRETSWEHPAGKIGIVLTDQTNGMVEFRFSNEGQGRRRLWKAYRFEAAKPEGFSVRGAIFKSFDAAVGHATTLARLLSQPVAVEPY